MAIIPTLWANEPVTEGETQLWILKKRAEYLSTIPCHLRSADVQVILDEYEKTHGTLYRQKEVN